MNTSVKELEEKLSKLDKELDPLFKERKSLDAKIMNRRNRQRKLQEDIDTLKMAELEGVELLKFLLDNFSGSSSVRYNKLQEVLMNKGFTGSYGYWNENHQGIVQISIDRDDSKV